MKSPELIIPRHDNEVVLNLDSKRAIIGAISGGVAAQGAGMLLGHESINIPLTLSKREKEVDGFREEIDSGFVVSDDGQWMTNRRLASEEVSMHFADRPPYKLHSTEIVFDGKDANFPQLLAIQDYADYYRENFITGEANTFPVYTYKVEYNYPKDKVSFYINGDGRGFSVLSTDERFDEDLRAIDTGVRQTLNGTQRVSLDNESNEAPVQRELLANAVNGSVDTIKLVDLPFGSYKSLNELASSLGYPSISTMLQIQVTEAGDENITKQILDIVKEEYTHTNSPESVEVRISRPVSFDMRNYYDSTLEDNYECGVSTATTTIYPVEIEEVQPDIYPGMFGLTLGLAAAIKWRKQQRRLRHQAIGDDIVFAPSKELLKKDENGETTLAEAIEVETYKSAQAKIEIADAEDSAYKNEMKRRVKSDPEYVAYRKQSRKKIYKVALFNLALAGAFFGGVFGLNKIQSKDEMPEIQSSELFDIKSFDSFCKDGDLVVEEPDSIYINRPVDK